MKPLSLLLEPPAYLKHIKMDGPGQQCNGFVPLFTALVSLHFAAVHSYYADESKILMIAGTVAD